MTAAGAVYARGYQPWDGDRGGRRTAVAAVYRNSLRRALGLRRSWRQKLAPGLLLGVSLVPALIDVAIAYASRDLPNPPTPISHRDYVGVSSLLLLFVAVAVPDLVCPDRRGNVLTLILARPLTGHDYALAKVAATFTCVFAFAFAPHVLLYTSRLLLSDDIPEYVRSTADVLWQVPLATAALALYLAVLGVSLSSLSGRRVVAAATVLGTCIVSGIVSHGLLAGIDRGSSGAVWASLVDLPALPLQLRDLIFLGHPDPALPLYGGPGAAPLIVAAYVAVVLAGFVLLAVRYRPGPS